MYLKISVTHIRFISILLLMSTVVNAQQQQLDTLRKNFEIYRTKHLVEKVYIHTDREAYLTGESIWFKAYVADGSIHKPLDLSKVLYLEIVQEDNTPVLQTKVSLDQGKGNGNLYLPATINSGNYVLRAYTNWMKNYPADYFFQKTISIVNTFKSTGYQNSSDPSKPDAQFFPEGGNLVAGITSKVAFRVVDTNGRGVDFRGAILNQKQDTVVNFSPLKFGIGTFCFTPKQGEVYQAIIIDSKRNVNNYELPSIQTTGYVLQVKDSSDHVIIQISGTNTQDPVFIFIHARNSIYVSEYKFLPHRKTQVILPKDKLLDGISHITIFDKGLQPVCERLYFKRPESFLKMEITTDNESYTTRRRVRSTIKTVREDSTPRIANTSVTVYRIDSLYDKKIHMPHYIWLSADLKGTIESPEYYFSDAPMVSQAVDNLMLTHGWRRFKWKDVLEKKSFINFLPEYRGHLVQGFVKNENGEPVGGIMTYLSSPGNMIRLYSSLSNQKGEVLFEMNDFKGASSVIIQNNITKDSVYQLSIENPFSSQLLSIRPEMFMLKSSAKDNILERSVAMQAQDIYYDHRTVPLVNKDSSAFFGEPDETYYLDDFTRFPVMEEVMREYVTGVWVRKRKDGFNFMIVDKVNKGVFNYQPLMLLDGVPFFDEDEIMNFSPLLVKKLEVVTRRYYLGAGSYPGVVNYKTYAHDMADFKLHPKAMKLDYEGLQLQREFYSPKYESPKQRESRMPDQRTLLYWNPDVNTSVTGKAELEFFTSDVPGVYQIIVEGITSSGEMGFATDSFTVKPGIN